MLDSHIIIATYSLMPEMATSAITSSLCPDYQPHWLAYSSPSLTSYVNDNLAPKDFGDKTLRRWTQKLPLHIASCGWATVNKRRTAGGGGGKRQCHQLPCRPAPHGECYDGRSGGSVVVSSLLQMAGKHVSIL